MKRFLTVLPVIALLLALAGCRGTGGVAGSGPVSSAEQDPSAGQTQPAETRNSAAPEVTEDAPPEASEPAHTEPTDPASTDTEPVSTDTEPTDPEKPAGKWVIGKTVDYNGDGSVSGCWEYEYDAAGNAVKGLLYDPDGTLLLRDEYEYDAAGRVTKFERYESESLQGGEAGSFQKTMSMAYAYDAAGNEIRYVQDDVLQWEAEYDASGTRIKYLTYDEDGELAYREEYEFDAEGRASRIYDQWTGGEETYWIPEYDEEGREKKAVSYFQDGTVVYYLDFEYDAAGNMTKRVRRHPEGNYEDREEWEYDAAGNQIQYKRYGVLQWKKEFDAAGNLTKNVEYSSDGTIARSEVYEYDANGNRIRETIYQSDGSVSSRIEHEYVWFPLP